MKLASEPASVMPSSGLVLLSLGGVDLQLTEQGVHAEGACLVGHDGHDPAAELLGAGQVAQQAGEGHRRRHGLGARTAVELGEGAAVGQRQRSAHRQPPARQGTVELAAAGHQVLVLGGVDRGPEVRRLVAREGLVGDLVVELQPVPQGAQLVRGHLLDLVGGVAALHLGAQRPALDRLGQDHGGRTDLVHGRLVGRVQLHVVVAAARQGAQIVVAEVGHHLAQSRVGAEEVLPDVGAALHRVALELAVDGRVHLVQQHPVDVLGQQLVPAGAPDHLDDVPARTAEDALELLHDLGVAPHRPVQTLQVAVDHPDQVVEALAAGERDGPERLGLVGLAVPQEAPHAGLRRVVDLAVVQVAVEAGVVDGVERAEPHRHGGVLPEVGHQPRVRIARQSRPLAAELPTEVVEVGLVEATLEERPGVDPWGGVALDVDVVAGQAVLLAPEEVVEAHLVEGGRGGEGGEVAPDALGPLVGPDHHRGRVPADEASDAPLEVLVAGEPRLLLGGDGVDVGRRDLGRRADLALSGALGESAQQEPGPGLAASVDDGVEGVEPLPGLAGVDVGQLAGVAVELHAGSLLGGAGTGRGPARTIPAMMACPRAIASVAGPNAACVPGRRGRGKMVR